MGWFSSGVEVMRGKFEHHPRVFLCKWTRGLLKHAQAIHGALGWLFFVAALDSTGRKTSAGRGNSMTRRTQQLAGLASDVS